MAALPFDALYLVRRDGYEIDTARERLDVALIHRFLADSYWSPGVRHETVERAIRGSLSFGLYGTGGAQAGFARAVTDGATFAYLADVFVLPERRGAGLGRWLVESALAHPALQNLRRVMLATRDAHGLHRGQVRVAVRPAVDVPAAPVGAGRGADGRRRRGGERRAALLPRPGGRGGRGVRDFRRDAGCARAGRRGIDLHRRGAARAQR